MGYVHRRASRNRTASGERHDEVAHAGASGPVLQRTAGNRAVTALLEQAQTKLSVGAVDDPLEHEADAVADQVVASIRSGIPAGTATTPVSRSIRRRSAGAGATGGGQASDDVEHAVTSPSGGQPLPSGTRGQMESAFGTDFGDVRVHTGAQAADLNHRLSAQAFTVGSDIFFSGGVPSATDPLLAHELTHVVQQRGGSEVARRKPIDRPGSMVKLGTEKTTEVEKSDDGKTTTTTTDRVAKAGVGKSSESSSDVFDGKVERTSEAKHEFFAGAEAACKTISKASDKEIQKAVELMARAGAFGESSRKAAIARGPLKGSAEGSISGKAGAEATAKGSVTVSKDLMNALALVAEAAAMVGAETTMEGKLEGALGPLAGSISGKLHAFAGAMASVKGKLEVGLTRIDAEFEAKVLAGAEINAEAEAAITLGGAEIKGVAEAAAVAGAAAEVKGELKIDLTGIAASGKAEAMAGVKAEAKASGSLAYKGRTLVEATAKVSVSAGAGGTAEGTFILRKGKIKVSGELSATLGIGGGAGVEVEVDLYVLGFMVYDLIATAFLHKKEAINQDDLDIERVPIIEQHLQVKKRQEGYNAYLKDFMAYEAKKSDQGNSGIKRERIEQILANRWAANKENWQFVEFDEGIMLAARDVFGDKLLDFIVQQGKLRAFRVQLTAEQEAYLKKQRMKKGMAF